MKADPAGVRASSNSSDLKAALQPVRPGPASPRPSRSIRVPDSERTGQALPRRGDLGEVKAADRPCPLPRSSGLRLRQLSPATRPGTAGRDPGQLAAARWLRLRRALLRVDGGPGRGRLVALHDEARSRPTRWNSASACPVGPTAGRSESKTRLSFLSHFKAGRAGQTRLPARGQGCRVESFFWLAGFVRPLISAHGREAFKMEACRCEHRRFAFK